MARASDPPVPAGDGDGSRPAGKLARVYRHRDFRLLWFGAFLSFIGSWVQTVAQGYLVFQMTGDYGKLAAVSFFGMLPVAVFGPFAGSLVDVLNKRMLLVASQAIYAVGALFLAVATYAGFVEYWHIVAVAFILGCVSTIEMPTRQSIVSQVVPAEDLPAAIPINALTFNLARLVGPAIGGVLLGSFGPAACYLLNGISFAALILAGLAIQADLRASAREVQPMLDLVLEGVRYTFRDPALRTLFILEAIVSAAALNYLPMLPAIAEDILKLGPQGLGLAYLTVGIGSVSALLIVMTLSDRPYHTHLIRGAMTLFGVCLILLSFTDRPALAFPLFAVMGLCAVVHFNTTNTLFQILSPARLRGRVLAMHIWALSGVGPFGVLAFGYVAKAIGLPQSLGGVGILTLLGAAYGWLAHKSLNDVGSRLTASQETLTS